MIVPYNMIPAQYLKPLNVETKMEYTINKKKFPGLTNKTERRHPALVIAIKPSPNLEEVDTDSMPIDLSKSKSTVKITAVPNHSRTRNDIVTQAKSKRTRSAKRRNQMKLDMSPVSSGVAPADERASLPEGARIQPPNRNPSTPTSIPDWNDINKVPSVFTQTSAGSHPSYLDFIYGPSGLLSQMATKNTQASANLRLKCKLIEPTEQNGKRKRTTEQAIEAVKMETKRARLETYKPNPKSKDHTIHYMPSTNSLICGGPMTGLCSDISLPQSRNLWPMTSSGIELSGLSQKRKISARLS